MEIDGLYRLDVMLIAESNLEPLISSLIIHMGWAMDVAHGMDEILYVHSDS
jgi:hypothetical protein